MATLRNSAEPTKEIKETGLLNELPEISKQGKKSIRDTSETY